MTGAEIAKWARSETNAFGLKSRKFSGAMAAEIIKSALKDEGIPTSARDVYVRGVSFEIDLIVPNRGQEPKLGLLYEPGQVAAALKLKKMGSFGEKTLETIRANFTKLRDLKVCCAYVAVEERDSYPMMNESIRQGRATAEINAGELHRRVGDYPGPNHRMPMCCEVMRDAFAPDVGDAIVEEPPSGQGAILTIKYVLPRPEPLPELT